MAHGFFVASRRTVRIRFPDFPMRTRAWRWARRAPPLRHEGGPMPFAKARGQRTRGGVLQGGEWLEIACGRPKN
jgi:hypothetical protein